jgi:hypothetical protein
MMSPKTQGNYVLVSPQKIGYRMFVGFEQFKPTDPSEQQFIGAAAPLLRELGVKLKRVASVR